MYFTVFCSTSKIITALSSPQLPINLLSGLNLAHLTQFECPLKLEINLAFGYKSNILIVLSFEPVNKYLPVFEFTSLMEFTHIYKEFHDLLESNWNLLDMDNLIEI